MRLWTLASRLHGLTHLHVTGGDSVSDDGLRAIASLTGLAHLHLRYFHRVTDEGVATLSSLTALKSLELTECDNVSHEAITALRQLLALDFLAPPCAPNKSVRYFSASPDTFASTSLLGSKSMTRLCTQLHSHV